VCWSVVLVVFGLVGVIMVGFFCLSLFELLWGRFAWCSVFLYLFW